jgi:hypothetical protein
MRGDILCERTMVIQIGIVKKNFVEIGGKRKRQRHSQREEREERKREREREREKENLYNHNRYEISLEFVENTLLYV